MEVRSFTTDFKEYYLKNNELKEFPYHEFLNLPMIMKFSVFMDFFAHKHIFIQLEQKEDNFYRVSLVWNDFNFLGKGIIKNSLEHAREEAFQIAKNFYSELPRFDDLPTCEY